MSARLWPVILASTFGVLLLLGLGAWQMQQLASKQALLDAVEAGLQAPPAGLSKALAADEAGDDIEFLQVRARGRFLHEDEHLMLGTFDGKAGWKVITPLITDEQIAVLVDRGVVPDEWRDGTKRALPNETTEVTGIVRRHDAERDLFSPDNDAAGNMWYWWDVPAMLATSQLPTDVKVAPFVLQAMPVPGDRGFPRAAEPRAVFRNNHLQYALTWFGLAAVLSVIAFLYVRGRMQDSGA